MPIAAIRSRQGFYLIVRSSAAALIGIQFVVITLSANMRRPATADSISAFGTPTVVQLVSALLISAFMNVPWGSLPAASVALAVCGALGLAYCGRVIRRARRQTYYLPERADWLWYTLLPCGAYGLLLVSALFLRTASRFSLYAIGVSILSLLLIGLHNAWDTITHIVVARLMGDPT